MNFIDAVRSMRDGNKVRTVSAATVYVIEDGIIMALEGDADFMEVDIGELVDETFELVPVTRADKLYAVYNTDKNRWISTTEPDKHKASGKRVAVFTLNETY